MFRFGLYWWSKGILIVAGIRLKVTYRTPLDPAKSYVFASNHQSALDIPILCVACLPTHDVRFMAKESLFKIPFLGWAIAGNGFVPIRRDSARHSAEIFKELLGDQARLRSSFIIFPEGTRSDDGRMQTLKRGAVGMLQRMNRAIVPVSLIDAGRANPKKSYRVRPGVVPVIFHEPLSCGEAEGGLARQNRDALTQQIYHAIASGLPEDQRPAQNADQGGSDGQPL